MHVTNTTYNSSKALFRNFKLSINKKKNVQIFKLLTQNFFSTLSSFFAGLWFLVEVHSTIVYFMPGTHIKMFVYIILQQNCKFFKYFSSKNELNFKIHLALSTSTSYPSKTGHVLPIRGISKTIPCVVSSIPNLGLAYDNNFIYALGLK